MNPAAALEYERRGRVPPYVESAPGRATLVTPPLPRWLAVGVVGVLVLMWAFATALVLGGTLLWWRAPWAPPLTRLVVLMLAVAAVSMSVVLVIGVLWLRGDSKLPFRVEIIGDTLSYNRPGPGWRLQTRQRALPKVKHVWVREWSVPLFGKLVDFCVGLRPFGTIQCVFRSPHAGFAAEVEAAFARAIEDGRTREEPPCSTG